VNLFPKKVTNIIFEKKTYYVFIYSFERKIL